MFFSPDLHSLFWFSSAFFLFLMVKSLYRSTDGLPFLFLTCSFYLTPRGALRRYHPSLPTHPPIHQPGASVLSYPFLNFSSVSHTGVVTLFPVMLIFHAVTTSTPLHPLLIPGLDCVLIYIQLKVGLFFFPLL
ncbi:hypothetical protein HOY80DRAFT_523875 [Tuber brumale]|nr:hypothetical protein HOY80DRAFT_523875 [Tuber brumale]